MSSVNVKIKKKKKSPVRRERELNSEKNPDR
jgi:hypothetical protein